MDFERAICAQLYRISAAKGEAIDGIRQMVSVLVVESDRPRHCRRQPILLKAHHVSIRPVESLVVAVDDGQRIDYVFRTVRSERPHGNERSLQIVCSIDAALGVNAPSALTSSEVPLSGEQESLSRQHQLWPL